MYSYIQEHQNKMIGLLIFYLFIYLVSFLFFVNKQIKESFSETQGLNFSFVLSAQPIFLGSR